MCSMGACGPLVSFFLFLLFLLFIVMPLDGEEHARAEHENLERKEDYRDPIHHLSISRLLLDTVYREERYLKRCFGGFISCSSHRQIRLRF